MKKLIFCALYTALSLSFVTAASLDEIKQRGVVRIGVLKNNPPFSKESDGTFVGFEVDFAKRVAQDIFKDSNGNGKVELVGLEMSERFTALEQDKVDITIAEVTVTPARAKIVDFTTPYFAVNLAVATRKEDNVKKLSDLAEKPILVEKGTTSDAYFTEKGFKVSYCSAIECYQKLKNGEGIGYSSNNLITMAYPIIDHSLEVNIKNLGRPDFIAMAVKKGNTSVLKFLNSEIINLSKKGYFQEAYDETISPFFKGTVDKKFFLLEDIYNFLVG